MANAMDNLVKVFEKANPSMKVVQVTDYDDCYIVLAAPKGKVEPGSSFYAIRKDNAKISIFIPTPDDEDFFEALEKRTKNYIGDLE